MSTSANKKYTFLKAYYKARNVGTWNNGTQNTIGITEHAGTVAEQRNTLEHQWNTPEYQRNINVTPAENPKQWNHTKQRTMAVILSKI